MPSSWTVFALSLSSLLPSSMIVERAFVCTCCDALRVRREKWCPLIRVSGFSNLRPPSWNGLCHFFGLSTPAQPQNKTNAYVKWWNDMKQIKYGQSVMMMMQWVGEWVSCDEMSEWVGEWVSEWESESEWVSCDERSACVPKVSVKNFSFSVTFSLTQMTKERSSLALAIFLDFFRFSFFCMRSRPWSASFENEKTTAPRIPAWSPTVVLTGRHSG